MAVDIKNLSDDFSDYLHDESRREGHAEKIYFPRSTNEVVQALEIARENFGAVTSV